MRAPHPLAGTMDISDVVSGDVLPFSDRAAAMLPPEPLPSPQPPGARPPQDLRDTTDITAFVPRDPTPFAAPGAAAPGQPRRRLLRFDPQTGQPLPAPVWVDLPPEPEGPKK
jgi:hypothetical protein